MNSASTSRRSLLAVLLLTTAVSLVAQIQPQAQRDNELWPIVTYTKIRTLVLQNGKRQPPDSGGFRIKPHPQFADGFIEISGIEADLDPLRAAPAKERAAPDAMRFRYKATLTADRDLPGCYGVLTFLTQGSIGTEFIPIGSLSKGTPKTVESRLYQRVEDVGTLHVFFEGVEVRSTQHPESYQFSEYYAPMLRKHQGIAAAELLKSETPHPHALSRNGKLLASVRDRDARTALIVYDLEAMKLVYDQPVAPVDNFVGFLTWVSDHELAYIAREDQRVSEGRQNLYLLDVSTGKTRQLLKNTWSIIMAVADHPEELILSGGGFFRYNVRTGKVSDLESPDSGYYLFDRTGTARVFIHTSGDKRICEYRPQASPAGATLTRS